jgi:multidrug resistance protein
VRKKQDASLIILALIMLINALSIGIIIPLLYPYASKFGLDPLGLSFLFASYSFFQLIATPIIGRLADRFGRKPLLLLSIFGTSVSLALFASAQTVLMLFVARIMDGITGGNISVAQAMISDKTEGKERTKNFGVLGAMFGLGILVGPAIGGFMGEISLSAPFWLASALSLLATILGMIILKETISKRKVRKQKSESLFNYKTMVLALFNPAVGFALFLTFIAFFAHQAIVIGIQAYTFDELNLSSKTIGILFASTGVVLIFMRLLGLRAVIDRVKSDRAIISMAFLVSAITMFLIQFSNSFVVFVGLILFYVAIYSLISPVVTNIISNRVNEEDQGVALGINQSYASLGQVLGPVSAGIVAKLSIGLIFSWGSFLLFVGFLLSYFVKTKSKKANF